MTDVTRSAQDEPFDLAMIQADELLLDALGRGDSAGPDDQVGTLLAEWRMDLAAEIPKTSGVAMEGIPSAPTTAAPTPDMRASQAFRWSRKRLRVRIAVAAAVVSALAGGTAVAAATATPGSPLWSITQVVDPARAHRLAAEDALSQARRAIADRRPDQAARLLEKAAKLISEVRDPQQAARLRAELAQIKQLLANLTTPGALLPGPRPSSQPPSSPGASTHPSPAPRATTGGSLPGSSSLPGASQLPVPPLKSLLPTTLPSLPLPGLGG